MRRRFTSNPMFYRLCQDLQYETLGRHRKTSQQTPRTGLTDLSKSQCSGSLIPHMDDTTRWHLDLMWQQGRLKIVGHKVDNLLRMKKNDLVMSCQDWNSYWSVPAPSVLVSVLINLEPSLALPCPAAHKEFHTRNIEAGLFQLTLNIPRPSLYLQFPVQFIVKHFSSSDKVGFRPVIIIFS